MTEEIKKTTKRGRPKKENVENNTQKNQQDDIIKKLMEQIEQQNAKMAELQSQIENNKVQSVLVQQDNKSFNSKKVKVINLMHNALNISTEPNGMGRVYTFEKYGDSRLIKFDDLTDIVASYPNTMENGLAYICDTEVAKELGLEEEYKKLFDKETMDRIIWLREESDLELFLGMDKNLQESTAQKIAELIVANEAMDYNYLKRIKKDTGIDIEEIANGLKEMQRKPNEEKE